MRGCRWGGSGGSWINTPVSEEVDWIMIAYRAKKSIKNWVASNVSSLGVLDITYLLLDHGASQ